MPLTAEAQAAKRLSKEQCDCGRPAALTRPWRGGRITICITCDRALTRARESDELAQQASQ